MGGLAPPCLALSLIGIYRYLKALTCLQVSDCEQSLFAFMPRIYRTIL